MDLKNFILEESKIVKDSIAHVYPAYREYPKHEKVDDISLVVIYDGKLDKPLDTYQGLPVTYINPRTEDSESEEEDEYELTTEDDQLIGDKINKHIDELCKRHTNITLVYPSASRYRNKRYISEKCITICCRGKGLIPFEENFFPRILEDIPIDVVEDYVVNCCGNTRDMMVGQSISHLKDNSGLGTVTGVFTDKGTNKPGLLTNYHVLAYNKHLPKRGDNVAVPANVNKSKAPTFCNSIYNNQNSSESTAEPSDESVQCGHITKLKYEHINEMFADAAYAEISETMEKHVKYGPVELKNGKSLYFERMCVCRPKDITIDSSKVCFKYGCITGLTEGILKSKSASVTEMETPLTDCKAMKNVMAFRPKQHGVKFADDGDSGSLIFYEEKGQPCGFGIVFGKTIKHRKKLYLGVFLEPVLESFDLEFNYV